MCKDSQLKSRKATNFDIRTPQMDKPKSSDTSFAEAVLVGALASGVNGPTWSMLKATFLLLGLSLTAMLVLAFSSSDFAILGHVLLLIIIGAILFVALSIFLAETGLVSVEHQLKEMGISEDNTEADKKK